jgi:hypothetical protein
MNTLVAIGTCSTVISEMTVFLACFALNAILLDISITLTLEAIYIYKNRVNDHIINSNCSSSVLSLSNSKNFVKG